LGIHACSTTCTNTIGSYVCSCDTGYGLAADAKTCVELALNCTSVPAAPTHGQYSTSCLGTANGSICILACEAGYIPSANVTCLMGTWTSSGNCTSTASVGGDGANASASSSRVGIPISTKFYIVLAMFLGVFAIIGLVQLYFWRQSKKRKWRVLPPEEQEMVSVGAKSVGEPMAASPSVPEISSPSVQDLQDLSPHPPTGE